MYTGSLAEQDIKGVTSMVFNRSLLFSSAREAMIAGTLQPNPRIIGINARPESPTFPIIPSMTYAALDIYPLSSRKAGARKEDKKYSEGKSGCLRPRK